MEKSFSKNLVSLFAPKKRDSKEINPFHPGNRTFPEANKWDLSTFVIKILVPIVGVHPFPLDEQLFISSVLSYFQPDCIMEWGTNFGYSARIYYELKQCLGLKTEIHSIDLPPENTHNENIHNIKDRGKFVKGLDVQLHIGDGLETAVSLYKTGNFTKPLFFLDGDHSYDSVNRELMGIKENASTSIVLVHDTFFQGEESKYNCGPYLAIKKFTDQYNLPSYTTALGLPGMSLIYWGI
jgi:predicted O-methyltransferase YrrM